MHEQTAIKDKPVSVESMAKRLLGPMAWITHVLKRLPYIGYGLVLRFEDDVYKMRSGGEILEWWSKHLHLGVQVEGLENVPDKGAVVLFCNHPTGLTDGIAMWDAVKAKRPDLKIMMNAQGLDQIDAFHDLLVPVRLAKDGSSSDHRNMWNRLNRAMQDEACMMMCPAGRLSQLDWFGDWDVHELPWRRGIVKVAKDFPDVPMVPVFIEGRVRKHYYVLHRFLPFLRDVLLYTEFHSKQDWPYRVKFMPPVKVESAKQAQALVEGQKTRKWFQLPRHKRNL